MSSLVGAQDSRAVEMQALDRSRRRLVLARAMPPFRFACLWAFRDFISRRAHSKSGAVIAITGRRALRVGSLRGRIAPIHRRIRRRRSRPRPHPHAARGERCSSCRRFRLFSWQFLRARRRRRLLTATTLEVVEVRRLLPFDHFGQCSGLSISIDSSTAWMPKETKRISKRERYVKARSARICEAQPAPGSCFAQRLGTRSRAALSSRSHGVHWTLTPCDKL